MAKYSEAEKRRVGAAIQELAVLFGKPMPAEHLAIWLRNFEANVISADQVAQAARFYSQSGLEFFPPFPAWVRLIRGSGKTSGQESWAKVIATIERFGAYNLSAAKNNLSPECWQAIRACGGYEAMCAMTYEQLEFAKRGFLAALAENETSKPLQIGQGDDSSGAGSERVRELVSSTAAKIGARTH